MTSNTKALIGTLLIGSLLIIYGYYSEVKHKDEVLRISGDLPVISDNLTDLDKLSTADKIKIKELIDKYEKKTLEANEALELVDSLDKFRDKTILDVRDNVLEKSVEKLKEKVK